MSENMTIASFSCPVCQRPGTPGKFCPEDKTKIPFPVLKRGFKAGEYIGAEKIGEGGMGEVWSGEQPHIRKKVAIKILSEKVVHERELVKRFQREALAVNKIRSKHIVDIFGFGELEDGRPFMVMELLHGTSLRSFLETFGPLPYAQILELFSQLCRALQAAHDAGIVHRDLKPDNIFVLQGEEKPFLKILDFGIAKVQESIEAEGAPLTADASTFGTPAYMSPEQCKGAGQVDHRADIYSLGIILYEMITGRTPFYEEGDLPIKVILRQTTLEPPLPSTMVVGRMVPAAVDHYVRRMLAKEPGERPQSCTEVFEKLSLSIGDAKSPLVDVMQDVATVWLGERAKKKSRNRQERSQATTKQETKLQNPAPTGDSHISLSVPTEEPAKQSSWYLWMGAALVFLGIIGLTLLFSNQPPKETPTPSPATLQSQPEPPAQAASASLPAVVSAVLPPETAPASQASSAPSTPTPTLPAGKATQKGRPNKTTPEPREAPKEAPLAPPEEAPKKPADGRDGTANPFATPEPKDTADPFGPKKP